MTRRQYAQQLQRYQRQVNLYAVLMIVGMFGGMALGTWVSDYSEHHSTAALFPGTVIAVLLCIGSVVGAFVLIWLAQRRLNLRCPACKKPLIGTSGQIAVATGKCGLCGEAILDE